MLSLVSGPDFNWFDVSGGVITYAEFDNRFGPTESIYLNIISFSTTFLIPYENSNNREGLADRGASALSLGAGIAAAVPLPATAPPLALLGLGGLGLIAQRRNAG